MKSLILVSIILFSIIVIGYQHAFALQQVAGIIEVSIAKGETKSVEWGLISDYPDKVTAIEISAEGEGAEFLSFPKSIEIQPQQLEFVKISITIPDDYSGKSTLLPVILATERGQTGGPTVINIQMKKTITLTINQPAQEVEEELTTTQSIQEPVAEQEVESKIVTSEEPQGTDLKCGPGTIEKDGQCVPESQPTTTTETSSKGGCLIATATFGTELAPQVQLLREVRDNVLFSTTSGIGFMGGFNTFYYAFSPIVADWERQNHAFKELTKMVITPMLSTLSILNYVDIDSEQEMLGYGVGIIFLNIGIYFVTPALVIIKLKNRFS